MGVAISIPGVYLVVANGMGIDGINFYGLLLFFLAITGSICYSFMVIKVTRLGYNIFTIVTWQFTLGALMFLPLFLLFGMDGLDSFFFSFKVQANIFALAFFCSCLCFSFWSYVTAKLGVVRSNIFSALIPAVSAIVAHAYGQESITLVKMLGIFIAATGIILVQWKRD